MDTKTEAGSIKYINRRLSQLKVLSRVMEHEIDAANGREVTMDRALVENMLDTLEIFIEDVEGPQSNQAEPRQKVAAEKPSVTRLN